MSQQDQVSTLVSIAQERAQLEAQIEALKAQNAVLLKQERSKFRLQVSEKGGVSVYGFGRFPVTLYPEAMEKMLSHAEDIRAFISANKAKLDGISAARQALKTAKQK